MYYTTVYNLSSDYNMMLNKNIIDCFDETTISQTTLNDIIKNYNIDQNKTDNKININSKDNKKKSNSKTKKV